MKLSDVKTDDEDLRVLLEAGLLLRDGGRFDEAEKILAGVSELAPLSDVPLVALGSVAVRRGDLDAARAFCEKALRVQPSSDFARVQRAEILLYRQQHAEAETDLRAIIERAPESIHAQTARALLEAAQIAEQN